MSTFEAPKLNIAGKLHLVEMVGFGSNANEIIRPKIAYKVWDSMSMRNKKRSTSLLFLTPRDQALRQENMV